MIDNVNKKKHIFIEKHPWITAIVMATLLALLFIALIFIGELFIALINTMHISPLITVGVLLFVMLILTIRFIIRWTVEIDK